MSRYHAILMVPTVVEFCDISDAHATAQVKMLADRMGKANSEIVPEKVYVPTVMEVKRQDDGESPQPPNNLGILGELSPFDPNDFDPPLIA